MRDDPPYGIADFIWAFIAGAMGFSFFPGVVLGMAGVSSKIVWTLSLFSGLLFAIYMHIDHKRS